MKLEDIKNRVDELITKANQLYQSKRPNSDGLDRIDSSVYSGIKAAAQSLILKIYSNSHPYYTELERNTGYHYPSTATQLANLLENLRDEITGGWLFTTKGIVSAEIFSDFMDMAEHLLDENYKDPAAVMIGSVLEEHLRQLAQKNFISIDVIVNGRAQAKKADLLNSELSSASIYNKLDHKNVTAWLDLRNKAAHGKYTDYTKDQVVLMYNAVMDFMTRISA